MPSITDSIGRVLGDRYRLMTALGTGASAHVYLAEDVSLHRRVAIKVLHPALAGDMSFLKRFRAEARAAAALNHPHVLQVYDWGEERGEPYLVLEYLAGGSLRQIYDTGVLLTPEQAVHVGIEAAAGLDYAHRRGLIHRDVKPANLLFDSERRLRIADFGLARALAEAAWTEPDGALLGTARYAAPEQVEGWTLDGKADVYALALVLYEGVTGSAPFVGDTTIATLMARVGTLLPEHASLGPLNDVLAWAAAPDPEERYDAAALALRLQALALALPTPEPLPVIEPIPDDVSGDGEPPMGTTRRARAPHDSNDATELGAPGIIASGIAGPTAPATTAMTTGTTTATATATRAASVDDPERRRTRRRWPWVVAVVVVLAALIAGGSAYAVQKKLFTPSHPVPSLVGKTIAGATRAAAKDHFTVRTIGRHYSTVYGTGLILSQRPGTGSRRHPVTVKEGSTIGVVVSEGPPPETFPNLTTFSNCNDAIAALKAVNLVGVCPASAAQYSSTVGAGGILGSTPSGTAPYGSTVTISLSKGHAPVTVPTVTGAGSTYASASAALQAAGFVAVKHDGYSSSVPSGEVIGTSPGPSAGPQPFGSTVTVDISIGPQPVAVPNVIGDTVQQATAALEADGLIAGGPYGPPGSNTVLSTDPFAGTSVLPGTTVILYTL